MLPTLETRLRKALKKTGNIKTIVELVEEGVDCNSSYFAGSISKFIFPIQLAAKIDRHEPLLFLYEHRNSPTKLQLDKSVTFYINHHQHFQTEKNDVVFDYTVSRLLYARLSSEHHKLVFDTFITSLHDYDEARYRGKKLCKGSYMETFLELRIYSLFRKLIDMKISSDTNKFSIVEKELLHNLEMYYFLIGINCIPLEIFGRLAEQSLTELESLPHILFKYYRCIAKNLITKIKQLDIKEEYTIPTGWIRHAVCVSFRRISPTHIVIRIDNSTSQNPPGMHETELSDAGWTTLKPLVLGQLHVDHLEKNLPYFISLVDSCKRILPNEKGYSLIYNLNGQICDLEKTNTDDVPFFDEQAETNCAIKCFEPGMQIRFGLQHPRLYQQLLLCEKSNASMLATLSEQEHQRSCKDIPKRFISFNKEWDAFSLPVSEQKRFRDKFQASYKQQYKYLLSHIEPDTRPRHNRKYVPLRFENDKRSVELKNILIKPRVLLLGEAGCGKTTVCQHMAYLWAIGKIWRNRFDWVFYVKMRNLNSENYPPQRRKYSLVDIINKECLPGTTLDDLDKQKLIYLLEQSPDILWILDGCDEQMHVRHLSTIEKELLSQSNVLLTSRPYVPHHFQCDIQLQIQSFTPEDIEKYISEYFSITLRSTGRECSSFIRCSEQLLPIASIPACLEIICNLWENSKEKFQFAMTITDVYQKMCKYLLERYLLKYHRLCHSALATRDIYREPQSKPFAHLEYLAFSATKSHRFTIDSKEIDSVAGLLSSSVLQIGLLTSETRSSSPPSAENSYYFIHRRFQEYLCARYMIRLLESSGSVELQNEVMEFITHEKYNRQMRDTFRLFFDSKRSLLCTDRFWSAIDNEPRDWIGLRHCSRIAQWFPGGSCVFPLEDRTKIEQRTTDVIQSWILNSNRRAHDFGNKYLFEWFADVTGNLCWLTAWKDDLLVEQVFNRRYFLPEVWSTNNIKALRTVYSNIPQEIYPLYRLITSGPTLASLRRLKLDPALFTVNTTHAQTETLPCIRIAQEKAASRTAIIAHADFAPILEEYHSFADSSRRSTSLDRETWQLEIDQSALENIDMGTLNRLSDLLEKETLFFRYIKLPVLPFLQLYAHGTDINEKMLCSLIVSIAMSSECLLTAPLREANSLQVEENNKITHITMVESRWTQLFGAFEQARHTFGYSSFFSQN